MDAEKNATVGIVGGLSRGLSVEEISTYLDTFRACRSGHCMMLSPQIGKIKRREGNTLLPILPHFCQVRP